MSGLAPLCTKCQDNGHPLRGCVKPWPFWDAQLCDRCAKKGHEAKACPTHEKLNMACGTCGHEGHHRTNDCPISDKTNEEHVKQWTKLKYEAQKAGTEKKVQNAQKTMQRTGQPGSHRSQGLALRPQGTPTSGPSTGQATRTGSSQPGKPIFTRVNDRRLPTSNTPEQKEKEEWAKHNLELADFTSVTLTAAQKKEAKKITTNSFKVKIDNDVRIHKYRIVLGQVDNRDVKKRETKKAMIRDILREAPPDATTWVTDYFGHIISVGKLYNRFGDFDDEAWSVKHQRPLPGGDKWATVDSTIFYEGMLKVAKVKEYINPNLPRDPNYFPEEDFRILNLLSWKHIYDLRNPTRLPIFTIGKKFYVDNPANIAGQLFNSGSQDQPRKAICEVKRGFFSSMRPGNGSLLLNVNPTTTAFFPPINLHEWITRRSADVGHGISWANIWKELKDLRVTFSGDEIDKPRVIHRIGGLATDESFEYEGQERTVYFHMTQEYARLGQFNPDARCVSVGFIPETSNDIWFPADKLTIIANQPFHGKMTGDMTAQIIKFAAQNPDFNQKRISENARVPLGITKASGKSSTFYSSFGLSVEETLLKIYSRNLPTPEISFWDSKNKAKFSHNIIQHSKYSEFKKDPDNKRWVGPNGQKKEPRDTASWDLKCVSTDQNKTFLEVAKHPTQLLVINVCNSTESKYLTAKSDAVTKFAKNLVNCLRDYGIRLSTQNSYSIRNIRTIGSQQNQTLEMKRTQFCANLNAAWNALCPPNSQAAAAPKLAVVALAGADAGVYADVRWWADCVVGIPCICISPGGIEKGAKLDRAMLGNVALKFNYRLGGTNHCLSEPLDFKGATMVVGADVTHPGRTLDAKCPSMAGVVATYDEHAMQYLASARLQPNNTEHIADLEGMMRERLKVYYEWQDPKALPRHIIFYRDGVSESQYGEVRQKELPQIRKACRDLAASYGQPVPSICLVIVAKRHYARFYDAPSSNKNILSGVIVDEEVVAPKQFNFYLQAHDSPIATALNAHYVVLEDESGYEADELQRLTHSLSFTGSRATKGLSVCTPARYADFLCTRLRCYMRPALESDLSASMGANREVNTYRQWPNIWNAPHGGQPGPPPRTARENPWNPELNYVMFYL